jgi:hypothetical protein
MIMGTKELCDGLRAGTIKLRVPDSGPQPFRKVTVTELEAMWKVGSRCMLCRAGLQRKPK